MLFQQQMRLPIHNEVSPTTCESESEQNDSGVDDILEGLLASREKAFQSVEDNIKSAQKIQKETYDRKHQPEVLPVGVTVLLENTKQKQRKGGKLEPLWLGPYSIHRDLGKGLYELKNTDGKVLKKKANITRLKRYLDRTQDPPLYQKVTCIYY